MTITPLADRLARRLVRSGSCLLWTGGTTGRDRDKGKAYGCIRISRKAGTKYVHILAYELAYGPVPEGKIVCHTCDTPICCEPAHLYAGTPQSNSDDKWERGRDNHAKGGSFPQSKLSEAEIRSIRQLRQVGCSQQQIADIYHVSQVLISKILRGTSWSHVE